VIPRKLCNVEGNYIERFEEINVIAKSGALV